MLTYKFMFDNSSLGILLNTYGLPVPHPRTYWFACSRIETSNFFSCPLKFVFQAFKLCLTILWPLVSTIDTSGLASDYLSMHIPVVRFGEPRRIAGGCLIQWGQWWRLIWDTGSYRDIALYVIDLWRNTSNSKVKPHRCLRACGSHRLRFAWSRDKNSRVTPTQMEILQGTGTTYTFGLIIRDEKVGVNLPRGGPPLDKLAPKKENYYK